MSDKKQTDQLVERRSKTVPQGPVNLTPFFAAHAKGAIIYDVEGREFIDFAGGIGVMNVGHSHPRVVAAIKDQAEKFTHTCWHVVMYEPYVELAEKLCALTPGSFSKMAVFLNSGAEAVENAVKVSRVFTKKPGMVAFEHAFHGRTFMAMTLTSKTKPYKHGFGPFMNDVFRMPYAYCYRCEYGLTYPGCNAYCAGALERGIKGGHLDADRIGGLIVEPVQGEGGFIVPPPEFMKKLVDTCKEYGIVFIDDEIQSGAGRTGKMFAIEHFGLEPDLVTVAKSFAGGMPLSAVVGRADIMNAPGPGGLGGTYGGNPVSCRAALAVLEAIREENLLARSEALGVKMRQRLENWQKQYEIIGEVRGLGPMLGLELVKDRATKEPAADQAKALAKFCYERGLIILSCGTYGNVIRTLAPIVIQDNELERGLTILEEGLAALSK